MNWFNSHFSLKRFWKRIPKVTSKK